MDSFSHDQQVGAPRTWSFAGRDWLVSGLTPYQLGQLEAHLKDAFPSPLAEFSRLVKGCEFTPEERAELFKDAKVRMTQVFDPDTGIQRSGWPVSFNSLDGQNYLFRGPGIGYFLWVVLTKHTPELSRAEADKLAPLLGANDLRELNERLRVADTEDSEPADDAGAEIDDPEMPPLPAGYVDPKK